MEKFQHRLKQITDRPYVVQKPTGDAVAAIVDQLENGLLPVEDQQSGFDSEKTIPDSLREIDWGEEFGFEDDSF